MQSFTIAARGIVDNYAKTDEAFSSAKYELEELIRLHDSSQGEEDAEKKAMEVKIAFAAARLFEAGAKKEAVTDYVPGQIYREIFEYLNHFISDTNRTRELVNQVYKGSLPAEEIKAPWSMQSPPKSKYHNPPPKSPEGWNDAWGDPPDVLPN